MGVWGCSAVGIGFVSSIWLMGLIVKEDPFSRVPFALSKERNRVESRLVGGEDRALAMVEARKREPGVAPPA